MCCDMSTLAKLYRLVKMSAFGMKLLRVSMLRHRLMIPLRNKFVWKTNASSLVGFLAGISRAYIT